MDRARIDAWIRFYDDVVVAGGDWPAEAWFAAVGDAMAAALPADSPILDAYRDKVRTLLALEQQADQSPEHARRLADLEREIQRLIGSADEAIRSGSDAGGAGSGRANQLVEVTTSPYGRAGGIARLTLQTVLGLVVVGTGLLGALYLYDSRLGLRVASEVESYVGQVRASIANLERQLGEQIMAERAERVRLEEKRGAFEASMDAMSGRMNEQMAAMIELRQAAMADLERRLDEESGEVAEMLHRLEKRAVALDHGFDTVDEDLGGLQRQLPEISATLARLASQAEQGEAAFTETLQRVSALQSLAPELGALAEEKRGRIEEALAREQGRLADLTSRIQGLEERFQSAAGRLEDVLTNLDRSVGAAAADRARVEEALLEIRAAGGTLAELKQSAEAEIDGLRAQVHRQMDGLLAEAAKQTEAALARGEDVLARALGDAEMRIEVAGDDAVGTLGAARERELAALAQEVAATRSELERARADLLENWRQMDQVATRRQTQLMRQLDTYGSAMEARVDDLLDALGIEVAANRVAR